MTTPHQSEATAPPRPNWKDYSPNFNAALLDGLKIQALLFILTALLLDGGATHRAFLVALLCQLAIDFLILVRRPMSPSKVDLAIVRYGNLPLFVAITWFGPDFLRLIGVEQFRIP
jgi:hypothetical protein